MSVKEESITAARRGFEASFAENAYYNRQTQDSAHLNAILDFLSAAPGMRILDLGTGSGYLSFALAKTYPQTAVTGLDIVEKTLERSRAQAEREHISNLRFVSYRGIEMPFADGTFDLVVSRYALHHFPDIEKSLSEVCRVLKHGGCFFLSDPAPAANDTAGFIDAYMQMKPDGHIRFRSFSEWQAVCEQSGLRLLRSFDSRIRFPRKAEPAYQTLIAKYDPSIISSYDLQLIDGEIYVTEPVNNMLFTKA
jgi:ubiquinone/menaquinone biosynthesis C-methylase UbiE